MENDIIGAFIGFCVLVGVFVVIMIVVSILSGTKLGVFCKNIMVEILYAHKKLPRPLQRTIEALLIILQFAIPIYLLFKFG